MRSKALVTLIMILMLAGTFFAASQLVKTGGNGGTLSGQNVSPASSLTPQSPIVINGNSGFTSANGVVSGDGTAGNPYLIEGWAIDASNATGISISNTDAFFIVENCEINNGSTHWDGITLENVLNGLICNCSISGNNIGISVTSSSNNTFTANNCSSCSYGIGTYNATNNIFTDNDCSSCSTGFDIRGEVNDTFANNNCSNSYYGIFTVDSVNNTFTGNDCSSSSYSGIYVAFSSTNNTFTGNDCSNSNAHGIYAQYSSNNTFANDDCSHSSLEGIYIYYEVNDTFINNNCSYCSLVGDCGITASYSANNTFTNNYCSNSYFGINIFNENGDTFINNNCSFNNGYGIYAQYSANNIFTGNNCSDNNPDGIDIVGSANTTITNSTCAYNENCGVYILNSSSSTMLYNVFSNNTYGIYVDSSTGTDANYCNILGNGNDGVFNNGNDSSGIVNASYCWWGSPEGPGYIGPGSGDNVSTYVLFYPWLNSQFANIINTISLSPSDTYINTGSQLTLSGTLTPYQAGSVTIWECVNGSAYENLTAVALASNGSYSYTFTPTSGNYSFAAAWQAESSSSIAVSLPANVAVYTNDPLLLTETTNATKIESGSTVLYTYNVTNIGDTTLTINLTDSVFDQLATNVSLAADQSELFTANSTLTVTTTDNATATGMDTLGNVFSAQSSATVTVIYPSLSVTETTNATIVENDSVVLYTFNVTNTGDTALSVNLTDDIFGPIVTDLNLPAGDYNITTMTGVLTETTTDNATATGIDLNGYQVQAEANATVTVFNLAISVSVSANATEVENGSSVLYTYNVTNTGDTVITVNLTDSAFGTIFTGLNLVPGAWNITTITETLTITTTNNATAIGIYENGTVVQNNASCTVIVIHPALSFTETANSSLVPVGSSVTFSYKVTNTGDTTISDVVVFDQVFNTTVSINASTLASGQSATGTLTRTISADTTTTSNVSAYDPLECELVASANSTVDTYIPTYTVSFLETGLPSGTSWNVTFNGVTETSTARTITFSNIASGNYSWYTSAMISDGTGTQFVASSASGSIGVPTQTSQDIAFADQYYISVSSAYGTPSLGSGWVNAGGNFTTSVTSPISNGSSTYLCTGYEVDGGILTAGTNYTFVDVQAPHSIQFEWEIQSPTTSSLSINSSSTNIVENTPLILSGTLSPGESGTVTIYQSINGSSFSTLYTVALSNGSYSYQLTPQAPGTYQFYASWSGDSQTTPANSATISVSVTLPPPTTPTLILYASSTNQSVGSSITLNGSITPTISGTVSLWQSVNGSAPTAIVYIILTNGIYSYAFTPSEVGTYQFYVSWLGNSQYTAANSSTITVSITAQPTTSNTTPTLTLTSSSMNVTPGQSITLSGTISPAANGTVTLLVSINGSSYQQIAAPPITNGTYTCQYTILGLGTYNFQATYAGNSQFNPTQSPIVGVSSVQPIATSQSANYSIYIIGAVIFIIIVLILGFLLMSRRKKNNT